MADNNENSTGCGGAIAKIGVVLTLILGKIAHSGGELFSGCARAVEHSGGLADDAWRASKGSGDDIWRATENGADDAWRAAKSEGDDAWRAGKGATDDTYNGYRSTSEDAFKSAEHSAYGFGDDANREKEHFFDDFFKKNKDLSETERAKLLKLAKKSNEATWNALKQQLEQYSDDASNLKAEFGENSQIVLEYENAFYETSNVYEARRALLPAEIESTISKESNVFELYGVFKGTKLNTEQAKLLSRLTNKKIPATSNKYKDYYLFENTSNGVTVKNINGIIENSSSNILRGVKITKNSRIIWKGEISDEVVSVFAKKKVTYIRTMERLVQDIDIPAEKIKLVYVASKKAERLKELFGLANFQVDEMLQILNSVESTSFSSIVENEESLRMALRLIRSQNEVPVVVFNNIRNQVFNKDPRVLGINDFITCNSFGIRNTPTGHISTNYVSFSDFTASIENAKSTVSSNAEEFWYQFSIDYNSRLAKRYNQKMTVTVVIGGTVGGAGGFAIYYNLKDS